VREKELSTSFRKRQSRRIKMKRAMAILCVLALFSTFAIGCTDMSPTAQGAVSGGAIGAGGGALLTAIAGGNPAIGAAVGGAAGLVAGGLVGHSKEQR
jgi:hypothetical protein